MRLPTGLFSSKRDQSSILTVRSKFSGFLAYCTRFISYSQRHPCADTNLRSISRAILWAKLLQRTWKPSQSTATRNNKSVLWMLNDFSKRVLGQNQKDLPQEGKPWTLGILKTLSWKKQTWNITWNGQSVLEICIYLTTIHKFVLTYSICTATNTYR